MPKADAQPAESTKARLLTATQEEIAERGWGGVRTRGVAGRAGVNNALVHYHFGSIDELKVRALESAFESIAAEAMGDALAAETAVGAIRSLGTGLAAARIDTPAWRIVVEAMVQATRDPAVSEMTRVLLDGYLRVVVDRLDAAVATGELADGTDTEGLARALLALLDGVALHMMILPGIDASRMLDAVADLIERRQR